MEDGQFTPSDMSINGLTGKNHGGGGKGLLGLGLAKFQLSSDVLEAVSKMMTHQGYRGLFDSTQMVDQSWLSQHSMAGQQALRFYESLIYKPDMDAWLKQGIKCGKPCNKLPLQNG